jgi:hypothetical protein
MSELEKVFVNDISELRYWLIDKECQKRSYQAKQNQRDCFKGL